MSPTFNVKVSPRVIPVHETLVTADTQDAALVAALAAFGSSDDFRIVSCDQLPEEAVSVPPIEGPAES